MPFEIDPMVNEAPFEERFVPFAEVAFTLMLDYS